MTIRPVLPDELPTVSAIMAENWKSTYRGILSEAFLQSLTPEFFEVKWRNYITEEGHGMLVAISADTVLGFAAFKPDEEIPDCLYLDSLHVKEKGSGIGTELIKSVMKEARKYDRMSINVAVGNDRAKELYERLGAIHYKSVPDDDFYGEKAASETLIWEL